MTTPTLFDKIHKDIDQAHTFDMPYLRYNSKPIPVFLWDDMQDYPTFMDNLKTIDHYRDYKYMHGRAITANLLLPWYNISTTMDDYPAFCMGDISDLSELHMPSWASGDLKPLSGKIVGLSLKALHLLDVYYENEYKFSRQMIRVVPQGPHNKDNKKTMDVHAYFNEIEDVGSYNKESKQWDLRDEYDFTPFRVKDGVYEM